VPEKLTWRSGKGFSIERKRDEKGGLFVGGRRRGNKSALSPSPKEVPLGQKELGK